MAQPFTARQMDDIREKLLSSARRFAIEPGIRKTSLEMLTAEAGIAKSSFYKFYESKEMLFAVVSHGWAEEILAASLARFAACSGFSNKERAAVIVYTAFEKIHELGIARFLHEDLPVLTAALPAEAQQAMHLSSVQAIFTALTRAGMTFAAADEIVLSVIRLLYLSFLHMGEVGEYFFPAMREMVTAACDRLVI